MLGKNFVAALLKGGAVTDFLAFGTIDHLFKGSEADVFSYVKGFVKDYGALPTSDTVEAHTGESLTTSVEPAPYYLDLMKIRYEEAEVKKTMSAVQKALLPGGSGVQMAVADMIETVMRLTRLKYGNQIVDLRMAYDVLKGAYVAAQKPETYNGLALGWPTVDAMTGGLRKGDTVAYVGRPGIGKTWHMLYGAYHGWLMEQMNPESAGTSRLFVTMEMDLFSIEQRLAAMHLQLPMSHVKLSKFTTKESAKFEKGLKKLQGFKAPFYIVDGNLTATVEEIQLLAQQLKPEAIFIDGAYLLKHPTERDRYKRVAENADLIKKQLANEICPVVCSWQFARTASKGKKKDEPVTLDDIAYADAIGQVSSLVLGIFEEEAIDTVKQRRVRVLKGRAGETGEFLANWDFVKMDFSEVVNVPIEELTFS